MMATRLLIVGALALPMAVSVSCAKIGDEPPPDPVEGFSQLTPDMTSDDVIALMGDPTGKGDKQTYGQKLLALITSRGNVSTKKPPAFEDIEVAEIGDEGDEGVYWLYESPTIGLIHLIFQSDRLVYAESVSS